MFLQFFKDRAGPGLGTFSLAWNALFRPTAVARGIRIGEREDFNRRLGFFLAVIAIVVALQSLIAMAFGVSVMPQAVDAFWQYLQPLLAIAIWLIIYLPLRIFRMTRIRFSEFFQAAAMSAGPTLFLTPLNFLPAMLVVWLYGRPGIENPLFTEVVSSAPDLQAIDQMYPFCRPEFDSLLCLNALGSALPQTSWSAFVILATSLAALVPIAKLIKHSTGITYSKLFASYIIVVFALGIVAGGVGIWLAAGTG